jgi:tetratricopeptide (TPR) repeat protein
MMHDKIQAGRSAVGLFADEQKRRSVKTLRMVIVCIFFLLPHIAAFGELAPNQVATLQNAITYVSRGVAKDKQGDLNGALADYNQAIKIYPKFPSAYFDRGLIKQRRGDLNGAMADYNRAIAVNPRYGLVYRNRGNLKQRKGDTSGAIADFNQAIKLGVTTAAP